MTGRERIEAAFSPEGAREIPAVVCYEDILFRDHWRAITEEPWWSQFSPDFDRQVAWRRDAFSRTGLDWMRLPFTYSREERPLLEIEVCSEGVFLVNRRNGSAEMLTEPKIGGEVSPAVGSAHLACEADSPEEVDRLVPLPDESGEAVAEGRDDLASILLAEFPDLFPYMRVPSPLWRCYDLWGFETFMIMVALRPELVAHAAERYLESCLQKVRQAAMLGARGIWIEECLTDMIGPDAFAVSNLPYLRRLVEEIRRLGMKSIYYFCGNPAGKWDLILSAGADALSLEEGKKGFDIDIEDVVDRAQGRLTLFGNLDSVGVLQNDNDASLRREIRRQTAAGRMNGSRFVMSTGSPVTPSTPVERVRRFTDLALELGGRPPVI
jgi:hypothetical protein